MCPLRAAEPHTDCFLRQGQFRGEERHQLPGPYQRLVEIAIAIDVEVQRCGVGQSLVAGVLFAHLPPPGTARQVPGRGELLHAGEQHMPRRDGLGDLPGVFRY